VEVGALHRTGAEIAVELSLSPIEAAGSPTRFVLAILRDMTERKRGEEARIQLHQERAHQALQLANARLEGVTLAVRELAHVLNNDLALAAGYLELIQVVPNLPPEVGPMLAEVATGLASAERHIRQFQQVVRVETKETPVGTALDLDRSVEPEAT
jgi:hypothetical protein